MRKGLHLNFESNQLTRIVDFKESSKISSLLVGGNTIMYIAQISMCHEAILSHLNLEVLDGISMCNSGTKLDASYNKLKIMPNWSDMQAVQIAYLQHNQISDIPLGIFQTLKLLRYLRLDKNKITTLDVGVFSGLEQLKSLNLFYNQLTHIDHFALYGLEKLEELYLEGNQLTIIPSNDILSILPEFKKISLNWNHWICKDLMDILRNIRTQNIQIVYSGVVDYHNQNLKGISCRQKFHLIPNVSTTDIKKQVSPLTSTISTSIFKDYQHNISKINQTINNQIENQRLLFMGIANTNKRLEMQMNEISKTLQALLIFTNQSSTISIEENSFQNSLNQIMESISEIATIIFGSQNTSTIEEEMEKSNESAKFLALKLQNAFVEKGNSSKDMQIIKIMFVVIIVSISCFILTALCNFNRMNCSSKRQMVQERTNASEIPLTEKINNIF